jgi:hypothetical protein
VDGGFAGGEAGCVAAERLVLSVADCVPGLSLSVNISTAAMVKAPKPANTQPVFAIRHFTKLHRCCECLTNVVISAAFRGVSSLSSVGTLH